MRRGLTSFNARDGLTEPRIHSIYQTIDGNVYIVHGNWRVNRPTENEFQSFTLNMSVEARSIFVLTVAVSAGGESGRWFALSENGLYQFSSLENASAPKIYRQTDGLKGDPMFCAFRDSRGDLWLSNRRNVESDGLTRYDQANDGFRIFNENDGLPSGKTAASFAEDSHGNVWFGFYNGGLARFNRSTNRFDVFTPEADGVPRGGIFGLHVDRQGRLWIASSREGLNRVDQLQAEKLSFVRYLPEHRLASSNVSCVTEDDFGNIYAGTVRGVDRLQPETGQIKHYSTTDGLAADSVNTAFRDCSGAIWFGTPSGLSRLIPEKDASNQAPRIFISNLNVAGNPYALSKFGQNQIKQLEMTPNENNLQIGFFSVGEKTDLRYQYKLEGADKDWSAPSAERAVNFSNPAPGSYRFLVRAINVSGAASEQPASVSFTIRPPFYRT